MVNLTTEQILNAIPAIRSQIGRTDLPGVVGLRLARLAQKIDTESQIIHGRLFELATKYALRDDKGEIIHPSDEDGVPKLSEMTIDPERFDDYQRERREMLAEEIEVDCKSVRMSQLLDAEGRVPGGAGIVLLGLDPFMVDDLDTDDE